MIFSFVAALHRDDEFDIAETLTDALAAALEDYDQDENSGDYYRDCANRQLSIQYQRLGAEREGDNGEIVQFVQIGFNLELSDDDPCAEELVSAFSSAIQNVPQVHQIVCFENPLLQNALSLLSAEIFSLEMKLRRVLTWIYLHAYQTGDLCDLLCEECVKPTENPDINYMRNVAENQFFYLTFSNYLNLNKRPEPKTTDILKHIRTHEDYDCFRSEILRKPIDDPNDSGILLRIRELLNSIEAMRNCVAHNRHPSNRIRGNYEIANPQLNQILDEYLSRWVIE